MFKLILEKAEEPEIKLPTSTGPSKKQESSRKMCTFALLTMTKPLTVWITINCEHSSKDGNTRAPYLSPEKSMQVKKQQLELNMEHRLVPNWKRSMSRLYIVTLLIELICRVYNFYDELDGAQAVIKIAGRNINNLRYADDTTLMAESEEELKSFLMKVKKESENVGLKLNIQKTKTMASGPITSWQIDGETMETMTDLFFWAPKSLQMVNAVMKLKDTCSLEEKL